MAEVAGFESIATGDFILVSHSIDERPVFNSLSDWKAKVLEVRALDMEHVYVRVSWLNRPEDLKGGRKAYHGTNELVPTNQMDVINAQAVNGTFELIRYDQSTDHDRKNASGKDRYLWRQTFNFTTKSLSVRLVAIHEWLNASVNTLTDTTDPAFMMRIRVLTAWQSGALLMRQSGTVPCILAQANVFNVDLRSICSTEDSCATAKT